MHYKNTEAEQEPQKVRIENLPDRKTVYLSDNVREYRQEEAEERIMYRFDEVVFDLPKTSEVTADAITADFDKWWEYGQTDQTGQDEEMQADTDKTDTAGTAMTRAEITAALQKIQEENALLSECLLEMSEIVYA